MDWLRVIILLVVCFSAYIIYLYVDHLRYVKTLEIRTEAERKMMETKQLEDKIAADRDVVRQIQKDCRCNPEKIYAEIHDDLVRVLGDSYKEKFDIRKTEASDFYPSAGCNYFWATSLVLAHKGQVDKDAMSPTGGYPIGGERHAERNIKFCQIIEECLVEKYPEEGDNVMLYLVSTPSLYYDDRNDRVVTIHSASEVYGSKLRFGVYKRLDPDKPFRRLWD